MRHKRFPNAFALSVAAAVAILGAPIAMSFASASAESGAPSGPTGGEASGDGSFGKYGTRYVDPHDEAFTPIEYETGGPTLNDRCPVRKVRLNLKMEPVWVNEHPVGFC